MVRWGNFGTYALSSVMGRGLRMYRRQLTSRSAPHPVEPWGEKDASNMSPIKDLQIIYKVLNEEDTFSAGDTVEGAVTFTLKKETKVKSVLVKMKGEARVQWSEGSGDDEKTYSDSRRYFKVKEYLVAQNAKGRPTRQYI